MRKVLTALTIAAALIVAALAAPPADARSGGAGAASGSGPSGGASAPNSFYYGPGVEYPPGYSRGPERYSPGPNGPPQAGPPDGSNRCWFWTDRDREFGYWGPCQ